MKPYAVVAALPGSDPETTFYLQLSRAQAEGFVAGDPEAVETVTQMCRNALDPEFYQMLARNVTKADSRKKKATA